MIKKFAELWIVWKIVAGVVLAGIASYHVYFPTVSFHKADKLEVHYDWCGWSCQAEDWKSILGR